MKMNAAELRVAPPGLALFFPFTHHFVVGFASLCHGSSHDLTTLRRALHPARAARAGDPGTPPQPARRVPGTPALALGSISEACIFEHWNFTFDLSKTNPA